MSLGRMSIARASSKLSLKFVSLDLASINLVSSRCKGGLLKNLFLRPASSSASGFKEQVITGMFTASNRHSNPSINQREPSGRLQPALLLVPFLFGRS